MEFKVGDIVYTDDPMIVDNCGGIHKYPAVIWKLESSVITVALRFPNFTYRNQEYHGSDIRYLKHVPTLLKELL
jgi:hypothetical protein